MHDGPGRTQGFWKIVAILDRTSCGLNFQCPAAVRDEVVAVAVVIVTEDDVVVVIVVVFWVTGSA